ncbi:TetR/AcrR family transcriptional regulator [Pseudonocardia sp. CA-107938]|uniref:TetR/AcrR family transcriptional regulator n=1 Tax=Pseudonocardia sp. CA-107938 TaxID=3240021 RepID=UPI003D89C19E
MVEPQVMRARLVEGAIRLVDEHGAEGLQVRKLAAAVGTSTMAVYTYFSGMPGVLAAVRAEGYRRVTARVSAVPPSDDPVADVVSGALAYRQAAVDGPHLFALAFARASPTDVSLEGERTAAEEGRAGFGVLRTVVRRAIDAGRFTVVDVRSAATQLWCSHHGVVVLEMSGFLRADPGYAVSEVLLPQTVSLAVGFGDDPAAARRSAELGLRNWERFAAAQ